MLRYCARRAIIFNSIRSSKQTEYKSPLMQRKCASEQTDTQKAREARLERSARLHLCLRVLRSARRHATRQPASRAATRGDKRVINNTLHVTEHQQEETPHATYLSNLSMITSTGSLIKAPPFASPPAPPASSLILSSCCLVLLVHSSLHTERDRRDASCCSASQPLASTNNSGRSLCCSRSQPALLRTVSKGDTKTRSTTLWPIVRMSHPVSRRQSSFPRCVYPSGVETGDYISVRGGIVVVKYALPRNYQEGVQKIKGIYTSFTLFSVSGPPWKVFFVHQHKSGPNSCRLVGSHAPF
jgi:hypothetical protein